jgi:hypothetical protein
MNRVGLPSVAVLLLVAGTAAASQQGQTATVAWRAADKCAKQAQAAFPDYDAESNAKRDAKLKECLNAGNLAPRQPMSQPSPR